MAYSFWGAEAAAPDGVLVAMESDPSPLPDAVAAAWDGDGLRDALRYRWLKDHCAVLGISHFDLLFLDDFIDSEIEKATPKP